MNGNGVCKVESKTGDVKARDWLARYLLGEKPLDLVSLAADEAAGYFGPDEVEKERATRIHRRRTDGTTPEVMSWSGCASSDRRLGPGELVTVAGTAGTR